MWPGVFIICGTMLLAMVGWSREYSRLLRDFQRRSRSAQEKLVVMKEGVTQQRCQELVEIYGGRMVKWLPLSNAALCVFSGAAADLQALAASPEVVAIEENYPVRAVCLPGLAPVRPGQPAEELPWGVERVKASLAWEKTRGAGVKVGILDTGVDCTHPDLKEGIKGGFSIQQAGDWMKDRNGHGTHVAGIIGARRNGLGVVGVAPECELYAIQVLDARGFGKVSQVVEGLQWAVEQRLQVVNMSLGLAEHSETLAVAVRKASQSGVLLVAAAGNGGDLGSVLFPARYPEVVAVAATTREDKRASYSSRGPEVDVAAPGEEILSTYPGGRYKTMSGTSMAAPHVAGVLSLLLSAYPQNSPQWARSRLLESAHPLPGLSPEEQGAGLVDAVQALQAAGKARLPKKDKKEEREES